MTRAVTAMSVAATTTAPAAQVPAMAPTDRAQLPMLPPLLPLPPCGDLPVELGGFTVACSAAIADVEDRRNAPPPEDRDTAEEKDESPTSRKNAVNAGSALLARATRSAIDTEARALSGGLVMALEVAIRTKILEHSGTDCILSLDIH